MDRAHLRLALVGSYRAFTEDFVEGNREAARWAHESGGRIVPIGVLAPKYYGRPPAEMIEWMTNELGFRVVGLFSTPAVHTVDWDAPVVRAFGLAASHAGVILQAGIVTEHDLAGVARAWGDLDTTVMIRWMGGHRYSSLASEFAVAAEHPRFVFDAGNAAGHSMVSTLVERFGASRVFFASNGPANFESCALAIVDDAEVSEIDRRSVRGMNVLRWLGAPLAADEDTHGEWDQPPLRDRPKVDVHWHIGHWNFGENVFDAITIRSALDRYHVEVAVVSSIRALMDDIVAGNAETAAMVATDRRLRGYVVVDPYRVQQSLLAIRAYAKDRRFVGLKTIQDHKELALDDECYEPILQEAEVLDLPVLAHLPGLAAAAARHPRTTFIAAHSDRSRAGDLVGLPNVVFDLSTSHSRRNEAGIPEFISRVGTERVVFGSDAPLMSPVWTLAKVAEAHLDDVDLDAILRTNAYRVFARLSPE
jgi:predicted TIM-barrel fold metal-dependent hydrolase